ncbi:MAG TPA: hypothetical protein VFI85_07170 [Methyloceanibacter sp.]|nr:hypothetical protein [Methyloceanibacter sp.]
MAKLQTEPRLGARSRAHKAKLLLPDPRSSGPFRPLATDPGWNEAWWWLGIPLAAALFIVGSYAIDAEWHRQWVTGESGVLETAQFIFMVIGFAIAAQLLFAPFVRQRPLVLAVTALAVLACLFIGGEGVSWGQHIFFWQDPSLVTAVNDEGELSLHNMNKGFERGPRALLEIGVVAGGLLVPILCAYVPWLRQSRMALFLPAAALVPAALLAVLFKGAAALAKYSEAGVTVAARPSEAVEFYLYFFMMAYLIIFERRIRELEIEGSRTKAKAKKT